MEPIQWFKQDPTRSIEDAIMAFPGVDVWSLRRAKHSSLQQLVPNLSDPGKVADVIRADLTPTARAIIRSGALSPVTYTFQDTLRPIKPTLERGDDTTLIISDIHAGKDSHAPHALDLAIQVGQAAGAKRVIINGDAFDCHALSRYTPAADRPLRWAEERAMALPVIASVKNAFQKAEIVWHHGNHDVRPLKWIDGHAAQLQGLFSLEYLLGIESFNFTIPEENRTILNGDTLVKHGIRVAANAGQSVMKEVIDHAMSVMMGHVHRLSFTAVTKTAQVVRGNPYWFGVELGCLCKLSPEYLEKEQTTANWQHGCAITTIQNDILVPELVQIVDRHAFFRGQMFTSRIK